MTEYIERETYRKRLAVLEGWCQDLRKKGRYLVAECRGVRESFFPEDVEVL